MNFCIKFCFNHKFLPGRLIMRGKDSIIGDRRQQNVANSIVVRHLKGGCYGEKRRFNVACRDNIRRFNAEYYYKSVKTYR